MSELKPCTFCGGEATRHFMKTAVSHVRCSNINCICGVLWVEDVKWNTRTQSQCDLKSLCKSYAEYAHMCGVMRVVPNYENWLIEQGLSTELKNTQSQWISLSDAEPEQHKCYWHTHVKHDGTFTTVERGRYMKATKKMRGESQCLSFTHFMPSDRPLPPKEQGQ